MLLYFVVAYIDSQIVDILSIVWAMSWIHRANLVYRHRIVDIVSFDQSFSPPKFWSYRSWQILCPFHTIWVDLHILRRVVNKGDTSPTFVECCHFGGILNLSRLYLGIHCSYCTLLEVDDNVAICLPRMYVYLSPLLSSFFMNYIPTDSWCNYLNHNQMYRAPLV